MCLDGLNWCRALDLNSTQPWVRKHLGCRETISWIFLQHASEQVFGRRTQVASVEVYPVVYRVAQEALRVLLPVEGPAWLGEEQVLRQEGEQDAAQAENVDCSAIRLSADDFRGVEAERADALHRLSVGTCELARGPEIGEAEAGTAAGDQDVVELHVAVDDMQFVQARERSGDLSYDPLDKSFF